MTGDMAAIGGGLTGAGVGAGEATSDAVEGAETGIAVGGAADVDAAVSPATADPEGAVPIRSAVVSPWRPAATARPRHAVTTPMPTATIIPSASVAAPPRAIIRRWRARFAPRSAC